MDQPDNNQQPNSEKYSDAQVIVKVNQNYSSQECSNEKKNSSVQIL